MQNTASHPRDFVAFICECGAEDCLEPIYLSTTEYEIVRSLSAQFAVCPGHEEEDEEVVVDAFDRFVLVKKIGQGRAIAQKYDPRA